MILSLFAVLFTVGFITYLLSIRTNEKDLTNTYQVQLSFLSIVIFTALVYAAFNIEVVHIAENGTLTVKSFVDYGYIAASFAMFFLNFINIIVLLFWGSYNMLFKRRTV